MGDWPDTRRILAVAPLIGDQRCYGETPVRLAGGSRGGWRNRHDLVIPSSLTVSEIGAFLEPAQDLALAPWALLSGPGHKSGDVS